jgi:HAD superfamily 5'-nucleotidase-like hydrolase
VSDSETRGVRGIFCNRTLNLRGIRAIGYDMDYTLIHYHVNEWERHAYYYLRQHFVDKGWPVAHLEFDAAMVCRGLSIDTEKGNLVKANRFGFIKHATHGTRPMDFEEQRKEYSRTIVDLSEPRWLFLNTLFSLSEGCFYAQVVDLLDQRKLPEIMGYADLYKRVRNALDFAHMEGKLKADILADPDRFVELDSETPLALLDQKHAGKKLMLITNSEWTYTVPMMSYAFDRFLPKGMTWRDLFDVVIIGARKPEFFNHNNPFFEVATGEGLLLPNTGELKPGKAYLGGSARRVEKHLGLSGDEILYVGDHMFGDVWVSKSVLRWRTALILRELEDEIAHAERFKEQELELARLMIEKERIEAEGCELRVELQRKRAGYGPQPKETEEQLQDKINETRSRLEALDQRIGPLGRAATARANPRWGVLMRAGNDKSHLAFQMERYAEIYTSRVSNFLHATPFTYLRSPRGILPHEPSPYDR